MLQMVLMGDGIDGHAALLLSISCLTTTCCLLSPVASFIFDPALYKIDIIIIKECSLTIHTNIAKELVIYSNLPPPAVF